MKKLLTVISCLGSLCLAAQSGGCASYATVQRADGSLAKGHLLHADHDIVVLRKVTLVAPRGGPASFTGRNGRPVRALRQPELAIPRDDIVRLTAVNRHARKAGIAGIVLTVIGLAIVIPSAVAYADAGGSSCGSGALFGGCDFERAGLGIGTITTLAGIASGIAGWTVFATSYRDEAGEIVPLAPITSQH